MFLVLKNLMPITGKGSNFAHRSPILLIWLASNVVGGGGGSAVENTKLFSEGSE